MPRPSSEERGYDVEIGESGFAQRKQLRNILETPRDTLVRKMFSFLLSGGDLGSESHPAWIRVSPDFSRIKEPPSAPKEHRWDFEGNVVASSLLPVGARVAISYHHHADRGKLWVVTDSHGNPETAQTVDAVKVHLLMRTIEEMLASYHELHRGDLREPMFVAFERAKRVYYAESAEDAHEATKGSRK